MTAAHDEAWIHGSLARLEQLETQREQLAAAGQTAALAEIDEEIRALYEVLESAAGDEQPAAAPAQHAPAMIAPVPMAPAAMAPAAMAAPSSLAPAMDSAPLSMAPSYDAMDDDVRPSRSPLPLILAGVLVVGGGAAAVLTLGGNKDKEAKPVATEPAKVIKSGEIVEDTQEPVVAKGADADRTSGTKIKERPGEARPDARRPSSGGSSSPASRPREKKPDDGRKIEVEKSRDPLAGM
jgi:hypothetical protein